MGSELWQSCACCDRRDADGSKNDGTGVRAALPLPKVNKNEPKTPYTEYAHTFPFSRMHINTLIDDIKNYRDDQNNCESDIKIDNLKDVFAKSDPSLFQDGTDLKSLLRSLPGSTGSTVTRLSLKCLGLLWCQGTTNDRATALLECLSPSCC